MRVAIDTSPLEKNSPHHIRGSGFYLQYLLEALKKIEDLSVVEFSNKNDISKISGLVHFPYFDPFFLTLPLRRSYKTVVTVHDLTPIIFQKYFPVGFKGYIKWHIQKIALQTVEAIITDSFSSQADIIRILDVEASKVHVIPLAAATHFKKMAISQKEETALRQKYALPEKFVLYVGDVTWNKNLPRLVNAIKLLNIPFFLAGKALAAKDFVRNNPWNKDRIVVEKLIEHEENIKRLGFVPDDELVLLYNLATVFAMPSLYEGFGLPVLEAMSCGAPVVTTKEGSLSEVGGDAAVYVNAYDTPDIAKGIKKVFDDSNLRKNLSEKGMRQAKKFSWDKTASMTMDVYTSLS